MDVPLTPDVEKALVEHTQEQGLSPEAAAFHVLQEKFSGASSRPEDECYKGSLIDLLAHHIGSLASGEAVPGGARMSEGCGRKFALDWWTEGSKGGYGPDRQGFGEQGRSRGRNRKEELFLDSDSVNNRPWGLPRA